MIKSSVMPALASASTSATLTGWTWATWTAAGLEVAQPEFKTAKLHTVKTNNDLNIFIYTTYIRFDRFTPDFVQRFTEVSNQMFASANTKTG